MKSYYLLASLFIITGVCIGCTNTAATSAQTSAATTGNRSYPLTAVTMHRTATDCWMVINNIVYDITPFIKQHPGGQQIIQGCGKDATPLFSGQSMMSHMHSSMARAMLNKYAIGTLSQ